MYKSEGTQISAISVHYVGNKHNGDELIVSNHPISISYDIERLLNSYFIESFKSEELGAFTHPTDTAFNELYIYAKNIFEGLAGFHETSKKIAKLLYECSNTSNIKGGELYVVYFEDCQFEGDLVSAIGIFKSETKETYLKVKNDQSEFSIVTDDGISLKKLDKGCLIFNINKDLGYIVTSIDNTNKGEDARYWKETFLQITSIQDGYYNTSNALNLCRTYVAKELPKHFEVQLADQIDILNRSMAFFKDNDHFNMEEFTNEVIVQPEVIESFNQYKSTYEAEHEVYIADEFAISDSAVKKQSRSFKSVIKLDKNFHIYIHGDRKLIEQGEDEKGRYYKVYFKEEQ